MSNKEKILTIIDKNTGEIQARVKLQDKIFEEKRWFALFQDSLLWIAKQNFTGEQYNVMLYMFNKLDFDNYIRVKQVDIVRDLNMKKQNVSRSVKVLKENDIIYEAPDYKGFYKLNPHIGHKGTKNYGNNVVEFEKMKYGREQKNQQSE